MKNLIKANKIKAKMVEKGIKANKVAKHLNIDVSTFYRKLNEQSYFTVHEVNSLGKLLGLTSAELMDIFFDSSVA